MSKKIVLIESISDFQRYYISVILHLTKQKTGFLNAAIQGIFDTKRYDAPLTNL